MGLLELKPHITIDLPTKKRGNLPHSMCWAASGKYWLRSSRSSWIAECSSSSHQTSWFSGRGIDNSKSDPLLSKSFLSCCSSLRCSFLSLTHLPLTRKMKYRLFHFHRMLHPNKALLTSFSAVTQLDLLTQIVKEWWGLVCSWLIRWMGRLHLWYRLKPFNWILEASILPRLNSWNPQRLFYYSWHVWLHLQPILQKIQNQFPTWHIKIERKLMSSGWNCVL